MTIIELGLLYTISNLPLWPWMSIEQQAGPVFYRIESAAKCNPQAWDLWNPESASWDARAGFRFKPIEIFAGHKSEHIIMGNFASPYIQSYDYIGGKIKWEF